MISEKMEISPIKKNVDEKWWKIAVILSIPETMFSTKYHTKNIFRPRTSVNGPLGAI